MNHSGKCSKGLFPQLPKQRICRLKNIWRVIQRNSFPTRWPFSKEHLAVSLSINILSFSRQLSPEGGRSQQREEEKKHNCVLSCPCKDQKRFLLLCFSRKWTSRLPLPVSPRAARREAIDYLAQKTDFVMFGANVSQWETRKISNLTRKIHVCLLGMIPLNMVLWWRWKAAVQINYGWKASPSAYYFIAGLDTFNSSYILCTHSSEQVEAVLLLRRKCVFWAFFLLSAITQARLIDPSRWQTRQ